MKQFLVAIGLACTTAAGAEDPNTLRLYWDRAVQRAGAEETFFLYVQDTTDSRPQLTASVDLPRGLTLLDPPRRVIDTWGQEQVYFSHFGKQELSARPEPHPSAILSWRVRAAKPVSGNLTARITGGGDPVTATLPFAFTPAPPKRNLAHVPEPEPARAVRNLHVGMICCPIWKPGDHHGWNILERSYPWRKPALGWYDESDPEVTDWEIKYAREHGIDYFLYCWYRALGNEGKPVQQRHAHAIHDGLFHSHFGDGFHFAILWCNDAYSGVAGADDLLNTLFPYWMDNYFRRGNYLKIDNKPVLYIYDIRRLVKDLGSTQGVSEAIDKMRQACRAAGFDGLWVIGESRQPGPTLIQMMRDSGFDASFAYCWGGVPDGADDATAQNYIMARHQERLDWNVLPFLPTLGAMWDPSPWKVYIRPGEAHPYHMSPSGFEDLCRQVDAFMKTKMPADSIGRRLILLDNWNEWSEGHYLAPCRETGFAYLDAFRRVFTSADPRHTDLLPEETGRGPYEKVYRDWLQSPLREEPSP